jgi:hypothetical protein
LYKICMCVGTGEMWPIVNMLALAVCNCSAEGLDIWDW